MDKPLENMAILNLEDYRKLLEELTLYRLRCDKQKKVIKALEKALAARAGEPEDR